MQCKIPHVPAFLLFCSLLYVAAALRGYDTSARRRDEPGVLNIHLIQHTHDDTGWLKTVDQIFYGANNTIQIAGVRYVLDSVVASLLQNPNRKFVYCEIAFFSRWWAEQDDRTRDAVKKLVEDGQLQFVNGGWVQHDEATAHYVAMIDQSTRGHQFLWRELGVPPPRIGWQLDPFGHSKTHASMMASFAGMEAVFFGRIDREDLELRKSTRSLEMLWRGGDAYGPNGDTFAGAFWRGTYAPPPGFNWELGQAGTGMDAPMQDDPCLHDYNVEQRLADFVAIADEASAYHQGQDIMMTMGDDFAYNNANHWFRNLDSLIHHLNSHPVYGQKYNVFYSTPEEYLDAKRSSNLTWPTKADDFFPYSDRPHCYWTGYFTSKAASKRYARAATSYLQAARQIEACAGRQGGGIGAASTDSLEQAVSLLQHHDAITGTAKKHVVNDYHQRIAMGWAEAREAVKSAVAKFFISGPQELGEPHAGRSSSSTPQLRRGDRLMRTAEAHHQQDAPPNNASTVEPGGASVLGECPLLNASICDLSVERTAEGGPGLQVLLYNSLAWPRTAPIRVPIGSARYLEVADSTGAPVESQIVPVTYDTELLQQQEAPSLGATAGLAARELVFMADLEPLSFTMFSIRPVDSGSKSAAAESTVRKLATADPDADLAVSNEHLELKVDAETGRITMLRNIAEGIETPLQHQFLWYRSSVGDEPEQTGQGSGAYIFRPAGINEVSLTPKLQMMEIVEGPVVSEIRQRHDTWAAVTHRLWKGFPHIEAEWTVGPIPIEDGVGREVVTRWSSGLASGETFWTDSNGREQMKRVLNHRDTWQLTVDEPVAANYYPVTAVASVKDQETSAEFFGVTDRAQGATSLSPGQLEFMVHRRTMVDDMRGVAEPVQETTCDCHDCDCPPIRKGLTVRGAHALGLQPATRADAARRTLQQSFNDPPVMIFANGLSLGPDGKRARLWGREGALGAGLPANVHLLTLMEKEAEQGTYLVRLAHLYEAGEASGTGLGDTACVDMEDLLGFSLERIQETTLTGVESAAAAYERRLSKEPWRTGGGPHARGGPGRSGALVACAHAPGKAVVALQPMEIKTFEVVLGQCSGKGDSSAASVLRR